MRMKISKYIVACLAFQILLRAESVVELGTSEQFRFDSSGKFEYSKDVVGNRLPDFSQVGYHSGEKAIPRIPVEMTLKPSRGDDTQRIQKALNKLGRLPLDEKGFRGTLLLKRGLYQVEGTLRINHSGTVLRGEGNGPGGTVIVATGYDDLKYQRALIEVGSRSGSSSVHSQHGYRVDDITLLTDSKQAIVDAYVPIGSHSFEVQSSSDYRVGDRIVVHRPSKADWIHLIGCDQLEPRWSEIRNARWVKRGDSAGFYYQRLDSFSNYRLLKESDESWDAFEKRVPFSADGKQFDLTRQWEAGDYDFYFERRILSVDGNRITIDAPIVLPIEQKFGGGAIYRYEAEDRIREVGIENVRLISEFATPMAGHPYGNPEELSRAEAHAWHGIQLDKNTENTWVRDVTGNYFGWSLVSASGKRATVQDCVNLGHASKITGGRRYSFMIDGQLNLVQRCLTYEGRHEFVTQAKTSGPNVFVDCIGVNSKSSAGPHHRFSVGTLFDNVKSENLMESRFRGNSGTGHGWAGTQTCFYNCVAPDFLVEAPPGGISWVIGSGQSHDGKTRVAPASLYYQQVLDRLGKAALDRLATDEQRKNLGKYLWVAERLKNERKSE